MIIKSIKNGEVLYKDNHRSLKKTLESAIRDNVNLSFADLRRVDLRYTNMDSANLSQACFWGSDLSFCDASESFFHHADFRLARFENTCLADSVLTKCDYRGAFFKNTIWDGADISHSQLSCPSVLNQNFTILKKMHGLTYHHLGEVNVNFDTPPIRITGFSQSITLFDFDVMIGSSVFKYGQEDTELRAMIKEIYNHKNYEFNIKTA